MGGYIDFSKILEEYNRLQEHPELIKPEQRCDGHRTGARTMMCEKPANHEGKHMITWE